MAHAFHKSSRTRTATCSPCINYWSTLSAPRGRLCAMQCFLFWVATHPYDAAPLRLTFCCLASFNIARLLDHDDEFDRKTSRIMLPFRNHSSAVDLEPGHARSNLELYLLMSFALRRCVKLQEPRCLRVIPVCNKPAQCSYFQRLSKQLEEYLSRREICIKARPNGRCLCWALVPQSLAFVEMRLPSTEVIVLVKQIRHTRTFEH
jgi:hypothetical protein